MSEEFSPQERLQILRLNDHERRWYSVDDKRVCLICERIISGREIRISGGPGHYQFACPTDGCLGNTSHWLLYRPTEDGRPQNSPVGGFGEMDFFAAPEQSQASSVRE
ncbi:MAG: hypothetical protein ABIR29_01800 [Chthoniobacterales bacterium]